MLEKNLNYFGEDEQKQSEKMPGHLKSKWPKLMVHHFKSFRKSKKKDLLILDDFGIQPFDMQSRLTLLEIMKAAMEND